MESKVVYHVVTITDLDNTLKYGIKYNDKSTYKSRYQQLHGIIDQWKPDRIPEWVIRSKAIFASMNFKEKHSWHAHSALLSIRIDEKKCWICNENIANFLYEPLVLSSTAGFEIAERFMNKNAKKIVRDYWDCSLSFIENLGCRRDKRAGYDAEVLILHDILPKDIELLYIASDHRTMEADKWKELFLKDNCDYSNC